MTFNPFSWFGKKKAFPHTLPMTLHRRTDLSHPESTKARDGVEATKEAQALRTSNDIIGSYVKAMQKGVIGEGTSLQYKSSDKELNKKIENWLSVWSEIGNCNIREVLYRQSSERLMVSEATAKGGFIIRHHWDKRFKTLYKFEILSCDNIDRTKNNFFKNLYFGTQVNKRGQIEGLWLYKNSQRTESEFVKLKRGSTVNLTLFLNVWSDPHQYTNVTPTATILNALDRLAAYEKAELEGAEERAKKSIIIANKAYELFIKMQEQALQTEKNTANKERLEQEYKEMLSSLTIIGSHNGAVNIMPDSEVWDLKQDGNTIYADLSDNIKRTISKGLGLSASTIMGIPESSYNVALKNQQEDELEYAIMGQDIKEAVLKPIYRNAIEAGYLLGKFDIENYYEDRDLVHNQNLKITRKKRGHIDPLRQNEGDAIATAKGFDSSISVITSRGKDPEDVIRDEVEYELMRKKAFEDAGLDYIPIGQEKYEIEKLKNSSIEGDE